MLDPTLHNLASGLATDSVGNSVNTVVQLASVIWVREMAKPETAVDAVFLHVAATQFRLEILIFVVDDAGNKASPPLVFLPSRELRVYNASGTTPAWHVIPPDWYMNRVKSARPTRRVEMVCHAHNHYALILTHEAHAALA